MFGVCKPVKGLEDVSGHFDRCIGRDVSALWTPAKDGRVFWFMCEKMDKVYQVPDIPTYTDADALDLAQRCGSMYCTDKVKFIDIWENRIWHRLFPLEEVFYEHWSYGRIACIGDAVHKVSDGESTTDTPWLTIYQWVPHLGSGGNHAIEDATVTANALYKLSRSKTRPNHQDIATALSKIRPRRRARAKASYTASNLMARIEATKSFKEWLLSYWIAPYFLTDFLMHRMTLGNIGAEKLEYLPDPPQSLTGTMAFNQNYGPGQRSQFRTRVLLALPLLLLAYVANRIFGGIIQHPAVGKTFAQVLASGQLQYHGHSWDLPTMTPPFNILVTFFSPSLLDVDPLQRLQAIAFLTDLAPLWLIWILESHRPANVMTFAWLPVLFGVAFQLKGIGVVGPLWFFLHSVQSPLSNYPALDWRMVNVAAAKTALVAVLVTLVVPSFAMYFLPDLGQRLQVNVVWQAFPVLTVVLHHLLRKMTVSDTTKYDRIRNVHADMPYIRFAIYALSAISAVTFNWVRFTSTASMAALVFPKWNVVNALLRGQSVDLDFLAATAAFLQVDEVVVFAAAFIWLALLAHDLKKAEMTSTAWWKIVVCAVVGTMLFGPGAVVAFAWFWRENLLATKKAKGSVGTTYVDVDRPEWSDLSRLQKFFASD